MIFLLGILVLWALISSSRGRRRLETRIAKLEALIAALRAERREPQGQTESSQNLAPEIRAVPPEPAMPPPRILPPVTAREPEPKPVIPQFVPEPNATWAAIEKWLVERWIIAAGGLTAALGGLFIVRYSIEQGLLGPEARTILGAVVGLALIGGAERVRIARAGIGNQQVPAALSAAGCVTLYGVIFAAHSFYALIPAALTFVLLAVVAFGSLAGSLLYGRLAAALGAGMGLVAPALVASDSPNAAVLFPYIFIVTAGIFAVIRYRNWPWLAWIGLVGNGIWQLSWMIGVGGDQAAVRVAHLLAIPAMSVVLLLRDPWPEPEGPWWRWDWSKAPLPVWTVGTTTLGAFGLLWLLAAGTGYDGVAAAGWGIGIAMMLALAWWAPTQQPLLPVVAIMTIGLAATWTVPAMTPDELHPWLMRGPLLAPTLAGYVTPIAAYAALFGAGGFALLRRSSQPGLWASVSASVPPLLLALLYARLSGLGTSLPWAGIGLLLALLALAAAERTAHRRPLLDGALAAYAAAVTAAVALAATMAVHAAWLTVALSLELPALAWIWRRMRAAQGEVPGLRVLAGIIAGILATRLFLNPYIVLYAGDMPILLNWIGYGYGVPALACWLAARWFETPGTFETPSTGDDWIKTPLQAAALAFATALMSLELWHMASGGGRLFAAGQPLRQAAAIGDGWLILGLGLLLLDRRQNDAGRPNIVRHWGWRLIGGGGMLWTALVTLLAMNPLWNSCEVGDTPVFNLLLLAYGLPALVLAVGTYELGRQRLWLESRIAAGAATVMSIATVLLEIRQVFHGSRLDSPGTEQAETYSYSVGMLLISLVLLAGGLRWPKSDLRLAGFGLLALTLGKAFLIDMDDLTGLWRAASFLGLGLSLIGIGYAYQKLLPATPQTRSPATQSSTDTGSDG